MPTSTPGREESINTLQARQSLIVMAIALVAGAAIGFAASTLSYRYHWLRPPGEQPFDRMSRSLGLSDLQRAQMLAVLQETRRELVQARLDFEAAKRHLMVEAYLRSRALLDPNQQRKFDRKFVPRELLREAQQSAPPAAHAPAGAGPTPAARSTPGRRSAARSLSGA